MNQARLTIVTVLAAVVLGGCATLSDEDRALLNQANQNALAAKQDAAQAQTTAKQALDAAKEAQTTANGASQAANGASQTASQALAEAKATDEKVEKMYRRSLRKR